MLIRQAVRFEKPTSAFIAGALVAVFAFMPLCSHAQASAPDSPAGHTLQAFFDSFNSGDHNRIAAYVNEYDPQNNADRLTSFSGQTGGFTLVSIVNSTPERLTFLVKGRGEPS